MAYKPYTMIGSRQTPQDILDLMVKLASKLATEGYTVRSGGADGADTCAEQGVDSLGTEYSHMKEIYLPWRGFNGRYNKFPPYYIADKLDGYKKARERLQRKLIQLGIDALMVPSLCTQEMLCKFLEKMLTHQAYLLYSGLYLRVAHKLVVGQTPQYNLQ